MTTAPPYRLVVIAASAGGVLALRRVLAALPPDFPLPVAVVQHRSQRAPDLLGKVLSRSCRLPVRRVEPNEPIRPGTVYLARQDTHLVVRPDLTFGLSNGRRIRQLLSSANPLFASAAREMGPVIAVVLTGRGRDATDGVQAVKADGGTVIVQDEATAEFFDMPRSAIGTGSVDYVLPVDEIGPLLVRLAGASPAPAQAGFPGDSPNLHPV